VYWATAVKGGTAGLGLAGHCTPPKPYSLCPRKNAILAFR
jgi:hypothetical protein